MLSLSGQTSLNDRVGGLLLNGSVDVFYVDVGVGQVIGSKASPTHIFGQSGVLLLRNTLLRNARLLYFSNLIQVLATSAVAVLCLADVV